MGRDMMKKCRICGWVGEASPIAAREMMHNTRDEFTYFECGNCHCLQIENVPENLGEYYGSSYYSYAPPVEENGSENQKTDFTKVLDVGCGSGAFLCGLAKLGFCDLTGCDPFIEKDIAYRNGVRVYKRTIHEMEGQYDWIYFNDSFEHVTDPHEVMASIKRLLSPKGVARIRLPVYPNIAYDMFGANWYQLDAPRHIFLHSMASLAYLAKECDLMIAKREYDSNLAQIVRSFLYSRDIPFFEQNEEVIKQYFSSEDIREIEKSCEIANQKEYGDHATFYFVHSI